MGAWVRQQSVILATYAASAKVIRSGFWTWNFFRNLCRHAYPTSSRPRSWQARPIVHHADEQPRTGHTPPHPGA